MALSSWVQPPIPRSIGKYRPYQLRVVDFSTACIDSTAFKQLINLLIAHFLAQIRQDVPQLPHTNEASQVLVKDLKAPAIFFWLTRVSEATRSIEDFGE